MQLSLQDEPLAVSAMNLYYESSSRYESRIFLLRHNAASPALALVLTRERTHSAVGLRRTRHTQ
jgi:hypothetical protein